MATDEVGTNVSAHDQAAAAEPKKPVAEPEDKGVAADTASGTTAPAAAGPKHAASDPKAEAPKPGSARGSGLHNR